LIENLSSKKLIKQPTRRSPPVPKKELLGQNQDSPREGKNEKKKPKKKTKKRVSRREDGSTALMVEKGVWKKRDFNWRCELTLR